MRYSLPCSVTVTISRFICLSKAAAKSSGDSSGKKPSRKKPGPNVNLHIRLGRFRRLEVLCSLG